MRKGPYSLGFMFDVQFVNDVEMSPKLTHQLIISGEDFDDGKKNTTKVVIVYVSLHFVLFFASRGHRLESETKKKSKQVAC